MGWGADDKIEEQKIKKFDFDLSEEIGDGKEVYVIYGLKGSGKTVLGMGFEGKICCLSFDNKSMIVKKNFFNDSKRIVVYNSIKYFSEESSIVFETAEKTYTFIVSILEKVKNENFDYIMFDCAEVLTYICEMIMRNRHGVRPFGGISNMNIWKERKALLSNLHNLAMNSCKKGIIYTLYVNKDEIIEEGEIVKKNDVPAWTGIVMYQSDFVLRTYIKYEKDKKRCLVRIDSSKNDKKLKTGSVFDITDEPTRIWKK